MGAVEVSLLGGLRQRSVFGGADREKEPIHSGTAELETFSAVNEELSGGIASGEPGEFRGVPQILAGSSRRAFAGVYLLSDPALPFAEARLGRGSLWDVR